jgi:hypothetical protein
MVCLVRYTLCENWFDLPPENNESQEWIEIIEDCLDLIMSGEVDLN